MGLGPVEASRQALQRAGMAISDIDLVEINEAFAAQVIPSYRDLGIDPARLNVNGGAIAVGHPFGMTGHGSPPRCSTACSPRQDDRPGDHVRRGRPGHGDDLRAAGLRGIPSLRCDRARRVPLCTPRSRYTLRRSRRLSQGTQRPRGHSRPDGRYPEVKIITKRQTGHCGKVADWVCQRLAGEAVSTESGFLLGGANGANALPRYPQRASSTASRSSRGASCPSGSATWNPAPPSCVARSALTGWPTSMASATGTPRRSFASTKSAVASGSLALSHLTIFEKRARDCSFATALASADAQSLGPLARQLGTPGRVRTDTMALLGGQPLPLGYGGDQNTPNPYLPGYYFNDKIFQFRPNFGDIE